jgi:ABC-type multidrug transport system fused ATPase/permease subunit
VIIAHRLTTIAACDRLMILEQGSVAAIGTRDEVRDHPFLRDRMV